MGRVGKQSFRTGLGAKLKMIWKLAAVSAVAFFFCLPGIMSGVPASAASYEDNGARMIDNGDGTQTLVYIDLSGTMKEVLNFNLNDDTYLIMTGKHNPSQSRWHYYTTAYNFTGSPTGKDMSGYSGKKVRVERVSPEPDVMSSGMLITTYKIRWEDVISAAKKCFTKNELRGKVTLYMSNIFQVRDRDNADRQYGSDISDYAVMANKGGARRSLPGGLQWSENTLRLLPAYYDIPITIEKVYCSMSVLKTNCTDCARGFVANGFTKRGMTCCNAHDAKDVWFEFESDGTDDGRYRYTTKKQRFTCSVDGAIEVGGKTYEVDAVEGKRDEDTGYLEVKRCDTFFSYIDTLDTGGTVFVGRSIKHGSSSDQSASYRFYKKNNRKYAVIVERDKPYDGVVIIPYRQPESEEVPGPVITPRQEGAGRKGMVTTNISYMDPGAEAVIKSDIYDVATAVPTTEELILRVSTAKYLFDASFETISGTKSYNIIAVLPYVITYKEPSYFEYNEETGEYVEMPGNDITVSGSVSGTVSISRDYSFTQIKNLDMYEPVSALIKNRALPGGETEVYTSSMDIPQVRFELFGADEDGHLKDPEGVNVAVSLPTYTYRTDSADFPGLPTVGEEYRSYVESKIGQILARNDKLIFGGKTVLDPSYRSKDAAGPVFSAIEKPAKCEPEDFEERTTIEETCTNGTGSSRGTLLYERKTGTSGFGGSEKSFVIDGIGPVTVHTPVVCDGVITSDNLKYLQIHDYDRDAVQIVTGRSDGPESEGCENDSCDFYVRVSNYGPHIHEKGYGTRDYLINGKGERGAYIMGSVDLNQVCFPFDVMLDVGTDRRESNDRKIKAGTWYTIGTGTARCYIGDDVEDGVYSVNFRTIAVNAPDTGGPAMQGANLSQGVYIATDSVKVQVSGKIFGMRLTDISDDLEWDGFGKGFYVGIRNELGIETDRTKDETMPAVAGQSGLAPNRGVLKSGYDWDFKFLTRGSTHTDPCSIMEIVPSFYHVGDDGTGRTEVDLYYNDLITGAASKLVRIGSERDLKNRQEGDGSVFTYGKIRLFGKGEEYCFTYSLPEIFHVAPKGTDVEGRAGRYGIDYTEDFWIRGGYVIVNFSVVCIDKYGRKVSSYSNTKTNVSGGCCSMWNMEGSLRTKKDWYGVEFGFEEGDVLLLYNGHGRDDDHLTERLG